MEYIWLDVINKRFTIIKMTGGDNSFAFILLDRWTEWGIIAYKKAATMIDIIAAFYIVIDTANSYFLGSGIKGMMFLAKLSMGMVCSHTFPGPLRMARKRPSPPKRTFLNPLSICMS